MSTKAYQCPCCGAPLAYSGEGGNLQCESCGNAFAPEILDNMGDESTNAVSFARTGGDFSTEDAQEMSAYICKNCGAELMTDATTTATECPYCGSPTILPSQIENGVKPEIVVPFKVTKEEAIQAFTDYFKGKRLLPNIFKDTRNRISEIKKLYVPYWLFDCAADAQFTFDAEKVHTRRQGDWEIKTTEHYLLRRDGSMAFNAIPVDSSLKMDDQISESLEPYNLCDATSFQPAVLAGALADHADVEVETCEQRAIERMEQSVEDTFRATASSYSRVRVRSKSIRSRDGKATHALMPVWLITTEKEEKGEKKLYTFAINGQTGALTCDVRPDGKKSFLWTAGLFLGISAVGYAILAILTSMGVIA